MSILKIKNKNSNGNNEGKFKVKDRDREKAEKLVQELFQLEDIQDDIIYAEEIKGYFIRIRPKNINILMKNVLLGLRDNFKRILNSTEQLQVLVVDKTQRLDENKTFLKELIDKKENILFKEILKKDLDNLNKISSKGASREFYFVVPFKTFKEKERIEQMKHTIENQGFEVLDCSKNDLKNMLQVYLERNFTNEIVKDCDI